jgi:hypothetical protein
MFPSDLRGGRGRLLLPAFRTTRSLLFSLLMTWAVLCGVALLAGVASHFADPPRDVPLPWSDFGDFVEGADGNVYVHVGEYSRVFCYSRAGRFIASYPAASAIEGASLAGVYAGESDGAAPRTRIVSADGTLLERRDGSLLRLSKEGKVLTRYNTPWYWAWGTLPWSVWLGCMVLFFTLLHLSDSARIAKKISCP